MITILGYHDNIIDVMINILGYDVDVVTTILGLHDNIIDVMTTADC